MPTASTRSACSAAAFTPEQLRELGTAMRVLTSGKHNTTQALEIIHDMLQQGAGRRACALPGGLRGGERTRSNQVVNL